MYLHPSRKGSLFRVQLIPFHVFVNTERGDVHIFMIPIWEVASYRALILSLQYFFNRKSLGIGAMHLHGKL